MTSAFFAEQFAVFRAGREDEEHRLRAVVNTGKNEHETTDKIHPARTRHADVMISAGIFFAVRHDHVARVVLSERNAGAYPIETIGVFAGYFGERGDKFFRFHKAFLSRREAAAKFPTDAPRKRERNALFSSILPFAAKVKFSSASAQK